MIVNELQYCELLDFLRPILRLESYDTVSRACRSILKMPAGTTTGDAQHEKPLLRYKGYTLDVLHFRWFDAKGMAVHLHFKAKKKWWHPLFKDENADLIADLKRICVAEIHQLRFEQYFHTPAQEFGMAEPVETLVCFHDARALNRKWRHAFDISPLMIAPDAHHGNCFVEFFFWGGAYLRDNGLTTLRTNWLDHACDVSQDIEREASHRLGLE
jgi:hypothetical protein